jgi:hypothetical protein
MMDCLAGVSGVAPRPAGKRYAHHDGTRVLEELGDATQHHEHASAQVGDAAEKR